MADLKSVKNDANYKPKKKFPVASTIKFVIILILAILFISPVVMVAVNSVKSSSSVISDTFAFPIGEGTESSEGLTFVVDKANFVGMANYVKGLQLSDISSGIMWSVFITIGGVGLIVLCTSMTGWFITRMNNKVGNLLYYLFVFSMIVPFQMVMVPLAFIANRLALDTPWGAILIYLGFGAGLSVFMFCGFAKAIPLEIEEAAMIDGCSIRKMYFGIVFPILKPTAITVAILNAMWIWNDFLLPYMVLDQNKYKTLPIVIQSLKDSYGSIDWGPMMAMIMLAILPLIIFYLTCQKYIIKGVVSGAVKG